MKIDTHQATNRNMKTPLNLGLALCLLCGGTRADAELRLPHIFGDHMVLQREKPVHVWGWADRDQTVTVSFAGQEKSAKTTADGKWRVTFDPMDAQPEGRTLTVKAGVGCASAIINGWLTGEEPNCDCGGSC